MSLKTHIRHLMFGVAAGAAACLFTSASGLAAGAFTITSPAFEDNAILAKKFGAKGGPRNCDGENISPPLQWSNAPEGTRSFAIITNDMTGRYGTGVVHWVAYGIPASTTSLPEGATSGFVGGKNTIGTTSYFGPCPDVGDNPHHYEFIILALTIEPGEIPPGLDFAGLMQAIGKNSKAATSIIGRYARAK